MTYSVRTQIEIDAPVSTIWDILIDLDRYHEWNPFVIEASGRIAPEAQLTLSPLLAGRRQVTFQAEVTHFSEGNAFAWTGAIIHPRFAKGEHIFRLTPKPGKPVLVDHDEVFFGTGAWLVALVGGTSTRDGFKKMNQALKARAEAKSLSCEVPA